MLVGEKMFAFLVSSHKICNFAADNTILYDKYEPQTITTFLLPGAEP